MPHSLNISPQTSRVAVLDGLRAMAIILVLMRHGVRPFWYELNQPFLPVGPIEFGSIFINGWMGVDLFFVLSGYLISGHLLGRYFDPARRSMDLKTYSKRRFFRIAPAYYFALTVAVLGFFPFYPYPETRENIVWRYIYHLLFLQDYLPSDIVGVFWSLAVEIKFYLLAPFILMALLRLRSTGQRLSALGLLFLFLLLVRVVTALMHPEIRDFEAYFEDMRSVFHLTLDGLLVGMACALIHQDREMRRVLENRRIANMLFSCGLAAFLLTALGGGPLVDLGPTLYGKTLLLSVIAAAFGLMLLGLRGGCYATPFFAWKGWLPVALISYSLYLLHLPLMYPAEILCRHFFNLDAFSPQMQMLLYFPFFLALSMAAATISYYYLERPFFQARSGAGPKGEEDA